MTKQYSEPTKLKSTRLFVHENLVALANKVTNTVYVNNEEEELLQLFEKHATAIAESLGLNLTDIFEFENAKEIHLYLITLANTVYTTDLKENIWVGQVEDLISSADALLDDFVASKTPEYEQLVLDLSKTA